MRKPGMVRGTTAVTAAAPRSRGLRGRSMTGGAVGPDPRFRRTMGACSRTLRWPWEVSRWPKGMRNTMLAPGFSETDPKTRRQ